MGSCVSQGWHLRGALGNSPVAMGTVCAAGQRRSGYWLSRGDKPGLWELPPLAFDEHSLLPFEAGDVLGLHGKP